MKIKKPLDFSKDIKNSDGFKGMTANWLWTTDDGIGNFAMRLMEFEPGGHTSFHAHLEEHQFYFLEGEPAVIDSQGKETRLSPGDTLYFEPSESHQVKNIGTTKMSMICMIPILPGADGKKTTKVPGKNTEIGC
ncbi:MAG: cupin domain-containing protein [Clostridia bacterium]|nr:cupin domain-containing protein [Clostridia bacterium]